MDIVIIVVIFMDYVMFVSVPSLNVGCINVCSMIVAPNMSILKCHTIHSNMHYNYDYVKLFIYITHSLTHSWSRALLEKPPIVHLYLLTYSSWIYSTC
jgi:hypothetical protein